jgi:hypothetical protein
LISFTVHVLVGSLEFSLASSSKVDMVLKKRKEKNKKMT